MATIHIQDLRVRAEIGAHSWERGNRQDLIINIVIEYDASKPCESDAMKDALDYEQVAAKALKTVERSRDALLEKLAARILKGVMADKRVERGVVRLDKPHAIAHAKCVSFELAAKRPSEF